MTPHDVLPIKETLAPVDQDQLAAAVKQAFDTATPLYPIGGGTSLEFGLAAKSPGKGLSVAGLNRVVDYPVRDLTVTVEAGVTMQTLTDLLAKERQRLPIDVPQADRATIGGVIATNWNGPRRYGEGQMRDFVIGIHAVDGRGMPFKGGGRVVKNVAGYDFCKLLTGSMGTLGVLSQVTLKLKPIPEQMALVACAPRDLAEAEKLLAALATSRTTPTAVELLAGPAWSGELALADLGPTATQLYLVVALEGTAVEVDYMRGQIAAEWREQGIEEPLSVGEGPALWSKLVEFPADAAAPLVLKASVIPSGTTAMIAAARRLDPKCSVQAHAGNGIVFIKLSEFPTQGLSRALVGALQPAASAHLGHVVVLSNPSGAEMTPQAAWGIVGPTADLMAEVKRRFDPKNILNPGRFVYR